MNTHGTVDFHAHPVDGVFRREMEFLGLDPMAEDGFSLPDWSVPAHLQFMEEAGIDYTVLSVPTPHIHNGDDEKSCASARRINEATAKLCTEYSEIFTHTAARMGGGMLMVGINPVKAEWDEGRYPWSWYAGFHVREPVDRAQGTDFGYIFLQRGMEERVTLIDIISAYLY